MRDRRLHLWNWLAIIAGWGVLLAWIRSQGSPWSALIVVQHSIIGWGLFLGMAFAIARRFGPIVRGSGARGDASGAYLLSPCWSRCTWHGVITEQRMSSFLTAASRIPIRQSGPSNDGSTLGTLCLGDC